MLLLVIKLPGGRSLIIWLLIILYVCPDVMVLKDLLKSASGKKKGRCTRLQWN